MTLLALDPACSTTTDRWTLTAAEEAVARLGRAIDPVGTPSPAAPAAVPPVVRVHLVPDLAPVPRPAPVGPASTRPPLIDDRILARRRESLAAERAARTAETTRGAAPVTDPTSTCCSLVLAAVEVLAGTRPVAQLARWLTPTVYEALAGRAALSLSVVGAPRATRRPEVRRVRVCRIGDHVAEASVVVDDGRRVRAVAVRLEAWRGAWRAVALEIG